MLTATNAESPQPGRVARVRQRDYLIEEVIAPPNPGDATLVTLSCIEHDAQGRRIQVLWELEPDARIKNQDRFRGIGTRDFDNPEHFAAYLNTLRWNCVTATDPTLFQSPFRAGIKIEDYQLEPLRKALLLPRVNLFIADDVGLGKTIEAGLIARELLLRKKVRTIVVSCPPSMLEQWQEELEFRFGLRFEILDREYVSDIRCERGFSVNPWNTHPRLLVSHRLLIDESYTSGLRDHLGAFLPGSLLILDEAHHAAPASGQRYGIDTKITKAVRDLAQRFEHRIFLSATPHNGHSNSFSSLLALLDNQRFTPGVPVTPKQTEPILVRRLKEDLRKIRGGFPERRVQQIDISGLQTDSPELTLFQLLDDYAELRAQRLSSESGKVQAAAGLIISGLQQRLLSSVNAFARTLAVHRRSVEKQWATAAPAPTPRAETIPLNLSAPGSDDDRATLDEQQSHAEDDARVEAASAASAGSSTPPPDHLARERALLSQLQSVAEQSRMVPDARVLWLAAWLRANCLEPDGRTWKNRRVLIFTEWEDTLTYLKAQIQHIIGDTEAAAERLAVYRGFTSCNDRERLRDAFNAPPDEHPLRILIATDAAREGLNLQAHCNHLFHFDVPWNPGRLEQRNGRIDRKLQPEPVVYCHYFVYTQRDHDRVLKAIVDKTARIRAELGSVTQVIEPRLEKILSRGIPGRSAKTIAAQIDALELEAAHRQSMEEELEAARKREEDLRRELEKLATLRKHSERDIQFSEDHFRATLDCALELNRCDRLKPLPEPRPGEPQRFTIPPLSEQAGAGWEDVTDTLREKRDRGIHPVEWRRTAPIRPVVFRDPGIVTNSVVQFHLEHPVVQRLLQRFLSQGFVHDDLSRTCIAHSRDAIKRVVVLGRLALYGPEAARLHEEIVFVTARWTDSKIRTAPLRPYEQDREAYTVNLLYDSLLETPFRSLPAVVTDQLKASETGDLNDLWPHLEARAQAAEADARAALARRGDAEALAMQGILELQRKQIEDRQKANAQLKLEGIDEEERRQREAERRFQNDRLRDLPAELDREPGRIRALYKVSAARLEPVGLVYLWPVGA
ncbi:MAG: DISARM system SNF2-like helicase DrmD [Bryobacteraceae bacterium]|nr:DISARM system SNF2-like helicase DrmD [Bryobacteraceae bacterium]